jgi:hypothetical protein
MSPLILVAIVVVGMAIAVARLVSGGSPRKAKSAPPRKSAKPVRKSTNRKPKRKGGKQRKPDFGKVDDDLLESFFDSMRDKR